MGNQVGIESIYRNGIIKKKGFTLIELLVVIAIIALLLSIMMPALKRAKEAVKRIYCLHNFKQLTLAWMLYANDNDGKVVRSRAINGNPGAAWTGSQWQSQTKEEQINLIKAGLLYTYCSNVKAYRCPSSTELEGQRTYCITGQWWPGGNLAPADQVIRKLGDVEGPTAGKSVFADNVGTDHDAIYNVHYDEELWRNIPNWRHNNGTTISFADGHAEHWKWKELERTVKIAIASYEYAMANPSVASRMIDQGDQSGNVDLHRFQKAVWGKLGYTP